MANTPNQRQILANASDDVSKAQANKPNYFDILSDEILLEIFNKMSPLELGSLALVCCRFSRILEDGCLWRKVVVRRYDLKPGHLGKLMRQQVQHLFLYDLKVASPSLRPALEAIQPSWYLKEVCLDDVEIHLDDLTQMFNKCTQLTKVDLGLIYVNNGVLIALSKNKKIEILHLRYIRGLQPAGLKILLQNARKLQEFYIKSRVSRTMFLDWNLIIDSVCANLAPSLLHLTLGYCVLSLTNCNMADIVRNCPQLQSLHLFFGVKLTARMMGSLRNLRHLRRLKMPLCKGVDLEDYLALATKMESLVELGIEHYTRSSQEREYIEELFGVNKIGNHTFWRVGTFTTKFGVKKLTY